MGKVRRGAKGRQSLKGGRVLVGYRGRYINARIEKQNIRERCLTLLETMRNPNIAKSIRNCAEDTLKEIIAGQEAEIKEARIELPQHKEEKTKMPYNLSLNLIGIRQAELDIIKALFAGAKTRSKEVQDLAAKAKTLRQENKRLENDVEAAKTAARIAKITSQQKP